MNDPSAALPADAAEQRALRQQERMAQAEARVGSTVKGKWHLDALLGIGGMSMVYAATHRNGKRAAIKMLNAECASQPNVVARFLREGYVANKLDHPASVSILDDEKGDDGEIYLVMDLVSGHSLERYTKRKGERLPVDRVVQVIDEVLDLLAAAHAKSIVHRDIKPANILVTDAGAVKVLDFGIARLNEQVRELGVTQNDTTMGTPAYMPPEQARGRWNQVDARSDLWSVGATMFALLVGDRPRHAETVQEELLLAMTQSIPPLAMVAPHVPQVIAEFVDRATAMDPAARFQDAREMQTKLRALAQDGALSQSASIPIQFSPNADENGSASQDDGIPTSTKSPATMSSPPRPMPPATEPRRAAGLGRAYAVGAWAGGLTLAIMLLAAWLRAPHTAAPSTSLSSSVASPAASLGPPAPQQAPPPSPVEIEPAPPVASAAAPPAASGPSLTSPPRAGAARGKPSRSRQSTTRPSEPVPPAPTTVNPLDERL